MQRIQLSGKAGQGKYALVGNEDYEELSKYKWYLVAGYARRNMPMKNGKQGRVFMHRAIANTPKGMQTDHIDGNKLNNTRANLRSCTISQNLANRKKIRGKGIYKGVHFRKDRNLWSAAVRKNGIRKHIGYFHTEIEAARAYDRTAKEVHGEFALLNF